MDNNTVTVYWSSSKSWETTTSYNLLYQEPVSLISDLNKIRNNSLNKGINAGKMFSCPAFLDSLKNVFVVKSNMELKFKLNDHIMKDSFPEYPWNFNDAGPLLLQVVRESSFNNYINIELNMGWLFFAEEPLVAKFTAPYFPTSQPTNGAIMGVGEFDIGSWYRDYTLDYHIPKDAKELYFAKNQPMFYLDIKTDKKIVFKQYTLTNRLRELAQDCVESPSRYGSKIPLLEKYDSFKNAKMNKLILAEIKNNLID